MAISLFRLENDTIPEQTKANGPMCPGAVRMNSCETAMFHARILCSEHSVNLGALLVNDAEFPRARRNHTQHLVADGIKVNSWTAFHAGNDVHLF